MLIDFDKIAYGQYTCGCFQFNTQLNIVIQSMLQVTATDSGCMVGIIESVERFDRANRGYTPYMVRRIKFILKLKEMGLTIKEMQDLYRVYGDAKKTDKMIPELINMLDKHIDMIDDKIARLSSIRKEVVEYRQRMTSKLKQ